MNLLLPTMLLAILKNMECEPHSLDSFSIEKLTRNNNNTMILSEIVTNYIAKYFSGENFIVSMISKSSNKSDVHFGAEFFDVLFNFLDQAEIAHNIIGGMDNVTYENKLAFNLILVDDSKILA